MEVEALRTGRGAAYITVQQIVTTLVGAVAFAFVARLLTQTEMGVVVGLLLVLGVFQILSDFGFGSGLTKYVAEYRGKNMDYTLITFTGIWTKVFLAGFFALACASFAPQLSLLLLRDTSYSSLFQLVAVDVFLVCVFTTVNKLLLGLNRFLEMAILSVIAVIVRQLFVVGLLILGYGLNGVLIGWILGDFFYVTVGIIILVGKKHIRMHSPKEVVPHFRKLVKFSWPLFLTDAVLFLYTWFDRVILLAYIPLREVAVYNVAYTAFGVLSIVPTALSTTLLPYLSEEYGKNKHNNIAIGATASTRYLILIFTPLALGLMSTAPTALTVFAGEGYAEGALILATLSIFGGIAVIGAVFIVLFLVYNMTFRVLLINISSVGVSIVVSFLLLPKLGVIAIAVAKGLAMVLTSFLVVATMRKRVDLKPIGEVLWKSWSATGIMSVIVWLVRLAYPSRYLFPFYILIGGIVYLIALRIFKATDKNDIRIARNVVGSRGEFVVDFLEKILG